MKERFEEMTLDQLVAIREVMCYLYPPMEGMDETAARLWHDLEDVRTQKFSEYQSSDEYKRKCAETDELYKSLFKGVSQ